ncbi:NUDIX pyrophosphatase [Parafrankia sp. BMG5.11]|uniref:NUDIX hydrolase n=1 Tax=Parafrankia sp. BMG5.11 TaxID=222540 RepID=UPI0014046B5A|nr:NUDIX pyrophosphatase [Parafrankia sp. BMG5.11]
MAIRYSIECWIIGPDCEVLLLRVPAQRGRHDAFWQPITGGIEAGETPVQAALRKIREETGLDLDETRLTEIAAGITVAITPTLTIDKTLYAVSTPSTTVTISPDEHEDHQWLPAAEVPEALYWDSNRDTWKLVSQHRRASGPA